MALKRPYYATIILLAGAFTIVGLSHTGQTLAAAETAVDVHTTGHSVTSFGAKCDGSTDDAAALARAVAQVSNEHGVLLVPCRVLVASGAVRVSVPVRFEF